ncbi:MAG TPA: DinB family protein [Cyclobacteriaceae bacterium]|nr:DinB family protein [Cyclobacteriaceae bacterium]HRW98917.1 DinB family protein [Cyclobacteriaceae bacterium]
MEAATKQYTFVKGSREVVFNFCETMSVEHFTKPVENFGRGSICGTQAHIADTYIHWIGKFALQKQIEYLNREKVNNVGALRSEFIQVNKLVEEFFEKFYDDADELLERNIPDRGKVGFTPLKLFTHVITHEFHHKGQMMSMARINGYIPPDTDLIRF